MTTRITRTLLVGGAITTVGLASLGIASTAHAATKNNDPQSSIIDKLATTFNLNKDEVKKVFDEERAAHRAEHTARLTDRLNQLVADKKLTQEQADKLAAKADELHKAREADKNTVRNLTPEERIAARDAQRDELKKWLSDNGIDEQYVRFLLGGHHGPGGKGMQGGRERRHGYNGDTAEMN